MSVVIDSIFSFYYQADYSLKDFSHDTHELIFFQTGMGTTIINGIPYSYNPNSICLTRANDVRDHICEKHTHYICIRFKSTHQISKVSSGVYCSQASKLNTLFKEIENEFIHKNYFYFELCNLKTTEILIYLSRLIPDTHQSADIYKLIHEIDSTLLYHKSIKEMAAELSYSYDYFRHKFKSITGVSVTDYIINKRIQNACLLLQQDQYSCTEIAQLCGFSSSSQFSNLFKKKMGLPPLTYQKKVTAPI